MASAGFGYLTTVSLVFWRSRHPCRQSAFVFANLADAFLGLAQRAWVRFFPVRSFCAERTELAAQGISIALREPQGCPPPRNQLSRVPAPAPWFSQGCRFSITT